MLAFPGMLVSAAEQAGISIPSDLENYDASEFPHWHVFERVQLGSSMPHPTSHFGNAEVVAGIPDDKIKTVTMNELVELGLSVGFPIP